MKYTMKAHLKKYCTSCNQTFYAVRKSQFYCSTICRKRADYREEFERHNPGELTDKPIVTYATSAAIPPQNLAYRWLYTNTDYLAAAPLVTGVAGRNQ